MATALSSNADPTLNATDTFWRVVAVKDSIDSIAWTLHDDRNLPHESMAKVDLHNAKVELNKALDKLYILIQAEKN